MNKSGWIVSPAPFILTRPTVSKMSFIVCLTLLPQILLLLWEGNMQSLFGILLSVVGSLAAELCLFKPLRQISFGDGSSILSGILVGMLLPSQLQPVLFFIVSFTGIFLARVLFGGTGSYWMNPVAVAICIAYISHSTSFPPFLLNSEGVGTVGDAFGSLRLDHFSQIPVDQSITGLLNTYILGFLGIKLPEGYITLLWNSPSNIPAFRFNFFTLISSIFLISLSVIDWIIPFFFLLSYGACVWFFSLLPYTPGFSGGDIIFAMMTSGILFIAFYILPEYTTSPRTQSGKSFSGVIAGLLAFFLCGPGGSPVGGVFTVLLINTINPLIEYLENKKKGFTW